MCAQSVRIETVSRWETQRTHWPLPVKNHLIASLSLEEPARAWQGLEEKPEPLKASLCALTGCTFSMPFAQVWTSDPHHMSRIAFSRKASIALDCPGPCTTRPASLKEQCAPALFFVQRLSGLLLSVLHLSPEWQVRRRRDANSCDSDD